MSAAAPDPEPDPGPYVTEPNGGDLVEKWAEKMKADPRRTAAHDERVAARKAREAFRAAGVDVEEKE